MLIESTLIQEKFVSESPMLDDSLNIQNAVKSSIDEPPELELKRLLDHLEYACIAKGEKSPVIISSALPSNQKVRLLEVL